jgi:hypothetical protein
MSDGHSPPFPLSVQILVITTNSTSNHFKPLDAAAQTTNDAAAAEHGLGVDNPYDPAKGIVVA